MKFWNAFRIFWIIFFLFFAIGLPLILHYGGHHKGDYEMTHTSPITAAILLGMGTAFWLIVFISYSKKFLINPSFKKNGIIALNLAGLLLLIALAAGILVYTYINESRGYGWRYLYFWHPYIIIPCSFICYSGLFYGITRRIFSKY